MRVSFRSLAVAVVTLATACSQNSLAPLQHANSYEQRFYAATGSGTVFVSRGSSNVVAEYPAGVNNPKAIRTISQGISDPISVATDSAGKLYVLNAGPNPPTVTEYKKGAVAPALTIPLTGFQVGLGYSYLAVGPDGTLYVGCIDSSFNADVAEYAPGATKPALVITNNQGASQTGPIVVDRKSRAYVTYFLQMQPSIVERYPAHSAKGSLFYTEPLYALALDPSDNLLLDGKLHVDVISPSGKRLSRFSVPDYYYAMSFDRAGGLLYAQSNDITIFDYTTKKVFGTISGINDATSVAVSPNTF